MNSIVVFPLHDKTGLFFDHLEKILPTLKKIFNKSVVSITPPTLEFQKGRVEKLAQDPFFELVFNQKGSWVGDHFLAGFNKAVEISSPDTTLHLCNIDRLAFALETEFKDEFIKDLALVENQNSPTLFHRSKQAWASHPKNYYAIESAATRVGEILFEKTLDFVWCHMAVRSSDLKAVLPKIKTTDLTVTTKIVLELKDKLTIKDVDWLAWEDPYILAKNPQKYKQERENSSEENAKRLDYVIPVIKMLLEHK